MTDPELLPVLDGPPKGAVVDHDHLELTDDEIALGRALADVIDVDDDDDNGQGAL